MGAGWGPTSGETVQTACFDLALLALVFLRDGVQVEPAAKFPGHNGQAVPSLDSCGNPQRCGKVESLRATPTYPPFSLPNPKHPLLPSLVPNFQGILNSKVSTTPAQRHLAIVKP